MKGTAIAQPTRFKIVAGMQSGPVAFDSSSSLKSFFFCWARFSTAGWMRVAAYSHRRRHGQGNFQVAATAAFLVARRGVEGSASGETQQRSRSAQAQNSAITLSLNHQSKTLTNQSIGRTFTDQTESRNSKIVRCLDVTSASYRSFPFDAELILQR